MNNNSGLNHLNDEILRNITLPFSQTINSAYTTFTLKLVNSFEINPVLYFCYWLRRCITPQLSYARQRAHVGRDWSVRFGGRAEI